MIRCRFFHVQVHHTRRQGNLCADFTVVEGINSGSKIVWQGSSPPKLTELAAGDISGVRHERL